jgi:NADPH-dependent 2,4-dienoyl-CoA reductase/sulfur reductase-like enzyme
VFDSCYFFGQVCKVSRHVKTITTTDKFSDFTASSGDYEYVVVGSGAGGGTLAARLALNGKKVLLIEAGDDQGENLHQQVPVFHAYSTEDHSMSWDYYVKVC